jgi:hypothetical protein
MRHYKPAKNAYGKDSEHFCGDGKDDLAMALQINNYVYGLLKRRKNKRL